MDPQNDQRYLSIPQWKRDQVSKRLGQRGTCKPFLGSRTRGTGQGYGRFKYEGKAFISSRAFALWALGEPRDGLQALHTCGFEDCCNVKHIRFGTAKQNGADAARHRKHGRGLPSVKERIIDRAARSWQAFWA